MGPPQAEDPQALASLRSVSWSASWRGSAASTHNARPGPGGLSLQRCGALRDFAGLFPANSHERSAQTRIGLGRTLVRIGRRWSALRTTLHSMTQGPFSPRARGGRPEIARKIRIPPGGAGAVEHSGSRVEVWVVAGRAPPSFRKLGRPRMGMTSVWPRRFISLRGFPEAPEGTVAACVVGRCVAADSGS